MFATFRICTIQFQLIGSIDIYYLSNVYGIPYPKEKYLFLDSISYTQKLIHSPLILGRDFNLIKTLK